MDVYTAKVQIDKLLEYVQDLQDAKPRMYAKSKDRWREVAQTCSQVIKVISDIIQDSALQGDSDEDETVCNRELLQVVANMQKDLSGLMKFVSYNPKSEDKSQLTTPAKVPRDVCRSTMIDYQRVFKQLSTKSTEFVELKECACLIHRWLDSRFIQAGATCKYNIRRIRSWVYDIVIVYSYHLVNGTIDDFIHSFNEWCANLLEDPESCKYAVPYEIYQEDSENDHKAITLTAVVLWDLLVAFGVSELCKSDDPYSTYLSEDGLYKLCEQYNQDQLDDYAHFSVNPEIVNYCGIHKYNQGE